MQDPDTSHLTGAAPAKQEPMAAKKKTRRLFPPAFKRQTVARIRAGKESGKETIPVIAKDIKVSANVLYSWMSAASKRTAKKKAARRSAPVARETVTNGAPAPAPPPVQASLEGCLAAIEQASATIRALRRQLFGG